MRFPSFRSLRYWVFNVLAATLLVLACISAWYSYRSHDIFRDIGYRWVDAPAQSRTDLAISFVDGQVYFSHIALHFKRLLEKDESNAGPFFNESEGNGRLWSFAMASMMQTRYAHFFASLGLVWQKGIAYGNYDEDAHHIILPGWLIPILALIFPAMRLIILFRRWYRAKQCQTACLCPTCFYDLRAHNPGTNCPECGTAVGAKE